MLNFNIPISIKPDATIKGLYTGRTYTASEELDNALEVMAVLERGQYLFSQHRSIYVVSPDDFEMLTTDTPSQPADAPIKVDWIELELGAIVDRHGWEAVINGLTHLLPLGETLATMIKSIEDQREANARTKF